ncbi:MAG: hypothetical protein GEV08_10085 [Acidimicrobiia bacterium]|nr:hypothetical protein [Acidimicrobiia bacterium]
MRLVSFIDGDRRASWGALDDADRLVDLGAVLGSRYPSVRALLADGALDEARAALASAAGGTGAVGGTGAAASSLGAARVTLLAPVTDPARILCAGVNYDEHRVETGREPNASPTIFTRYPSSLSGTGVALTRPRETERFDYEGELAVVIGRRGRRIATNAALGHVAGYSCFMDGSVRDWQRKASQFTPGKNFDASGSFGPWLLTADEVPDPQALELRTIVDGDVLQRASTALMTFSVAELIAFCSTFTTLEPGDVIATGTPGGVGDRRTPPRYLVPGSKVVVEISGVGRLENDVTTD